jgi:UDP-N-acetylmuramoyl-tripeptide--D-alanyl-D-alanine ligase
MDALSIRFIVKACAGELINAADSRSSVLALRVCTDSRLVRAGDLFVALAGERFDGHDFLTEVVKRGVAAVMVKRGKFLPDLANCAGIVVDDTRQALACLASAYRQDFELPIVAVAGSNGKTTTKELIASVLKQKFATLSSEASFNNDIGVPMTLLNLERKHNAAVLEVGTNHPGELEPLVKMIGPQFGVITCIGREHLEFFGDVAGVAREQSALAKLLPLNGTLFVNGDNEWSEQIVEQTRAEAIRVGISDYNDWRLRSVRLDQQGARFGIESPAEFEDEFNGDYRINLIGRHQVLNALLAVAVGASMGLSKAQLERGLAQCKPAKMRLEMWELNGIRVLDDAYNANADSMLAALQTLREFPCKGRRLAVLGDMAELGEHSEAAHEEIGRRAAELGVGQLFAVGKMAPIMARGARGAGLNRVFEFSEVETAATAVKSFLKTGDLVLLKASRSARLERISEKLRGRSVVE